MKKCKTLEHLIKLGFEPTFDKMSETPSYYFKGSFFYVLYLGDENPEFIEEFGFAHVVKFYYSEQDYFDNYGEIRQEKTANNLSEILTILN